VRPMLALTRKSEWFALLLSSEVEEAQKKIGGRWTKVGMLDQVSLWQVEPMPE
jgi:hypothetical protein